MGVHGVGVGVGLEGGLAPGGAAVDISPISRPYLAHISPISPYLSRARRRRCRYLAYISPISRPYLAYLSLSLSRQEAPLSMKQSRWPLAYAMRAGRCEAGVAPMRLAWSGEIWGDMGEM